VTEEDRVTYPRKDLMVQEHRLLRAEMAANRRFVFERPVVIITAGIAVLAGLYRLGGESTSLLAYTNVLIVPCLGVLGFNLWFTANRLSSNARIVAYIQLVLEPGSESAGTKPLANWIGWENALWLWRQHGVEWPRWRLRPSRAEKRKAGTFRSFYLPIFVVHFLAGIFVAVLLVALLCCQLHACRNQEAALTLLEKYAVGASFASVVLYFLLCVAHWRSDSRYSIRFHNITWREVLRLPELKDRDKASETTSREDTEPGGSS